MSILFGKRSRKIKVKDGDLRSGRRKLKTETKHGLLVLFLFTLSFILLLALAQLAGPLGQWLHRALHWFAGSAGWVIPFVLLSLAYALMQPEFRFRTHHLLGLIMIALGATGLLHTGSRASDGWEQITSGVGGGLLGYLAFMPLFKILGLWASVLLLVALVIGGILVLFETSLKNLLSPLTFIGKGLASLFSRTRVTPEEEPKIDQGDQALDEEVEDGQLSVKKLSKLVPTFKSRATKITTPTQEPLLKVRTSKRKIDIPIELLKTASGKPTSGDIKVQMEKIKQALANFGIEVEMGEVSVGPTVTQYTLKPAEGVKLANITSLANDLALALAAHPIRIEAPIPGKALVGIEVPNEAVATVGLREILESDPFKKRRSNLTVSLGKDVAGKPWVADLESMPHLLIAGATGSGKSVCINSMLISLLYTNSPDDLKLIIIDPKRVELTSYNEVPHLLTPVITEIDKTINALKWVVAEMDRRYQTLAQAGKRNITAFQQDGGDMPYIVVVIDELADLMSVAANDVEAAIIRLAQMARAVGIHLIVATQRPSVDVITGLIKANIINRIAFAVASGIDSRTIIDVSGAEKLLGKGDCLYLSPQLSKPKRLQCALVSDGEIERIASFLSSKQKTEFNAAIVTKAVGGLLSVSGEGDDLFDEAKALVVRAGKASASLLQRRLRVGYARAARLLDLLEEAQIIGPGEGAKPRDVLLDQESYEAEVTKSLGEPEIIEPETVAKEEVEEVDDKEPETEVELEQEEEEKLE